MKVKKWYWSPASHFDKEGEGFSIRGEKYSDSIAALFPDYYYLTAKGACLTEILKSFEDRDGYMIREFTENLIERGILREKIDNPVDVFSGQKELLGVDVVDSYEKKHQEDKDLVYRSIYRKISTTEGRIPLEEIPHTKGVGYRRQTTRVFDTEKKIDARVFAHFLSVLRPKDGEKDHPKFLFPSGGGLYPIDYYIYVKEDRVEGIPPGLYLYDAMENLLRVVQLEAEIDPRVHYFGNQDIFEKSAFSIYFVLNSKYGFDKYGDLGYFLGIVDSGVVLQLLSVQGEESGLGTCSIGEMDFQKIEPLFQLTREQVFLHCLEVGRKVEDCDEQ